MEKLKRILKNPPVSFYLLLTISFFVSLQVVNLCIESGLPNWYPMNHLRRFTDAMLFALPVCVLHRRRYLYPYLLLVAFYLLANVWYYRNYSTLMPFSAFTQFENIHGIETSTLHSMRLIDIGIILPIFTFSYLYARLKRSRTKQNSGG